MRPYPLPLPASWAFLRAGAPGPLHASAIQLPRLIGLGLLTGLSWGAQAQPLPPPAPTLAQRYHPGVDVQAYWVSEKYDGVRGLWNGQQLLTRQGLPIAAPAWFTAGWPATPLDGELWAGRGAFAQAQAAVAQSRPEDARWRGIRYMVFDLPVHPGGFSVRLPALQQTVAALGQPWVQATPQWHVASHGELMAQLRAHERAGAEGLMLRHAEAPYRGGRSDDLLKLKSFEDAEALVVAHLPGKGADPGRTRALLVQMPDGRQFRLGSGLSAKQRQAPPPVGAVVTYRFNGLHASGLPRFARLWRVRADEPASAGLAGAATPFPGPATDPDSTTRTAAPD
jgi:DNA ligase-1